MPANRLQRYYDESCRIRGLIIDETSKLERQMDDFICQSLVGSLNEKIDFVKELFIENDVIYAKKVKIAVGILKKKCKTVAAYDKQYKTLNDDLKKIGEVRNFLAHGCTITPENLDFVKYKIAISHKKDKKHLTHLQVAAHLKLIHIVHVAFISHFNYGRLK